MEHHSNVPDVQLTSQQGPLRSTGTIFKCFWIKGVAEHKGPLIPDPLYRQGQSRDRAGFSKEAELQLNFPALLPEIGFMCRSC